MPRQLVLIVIEDNAAERALIDGLLADHPRIERRAVESLVAAQRAVDERCPDVILLDLELPDARGLDGIARLIRRNPAVAIVVVSGFGADDLLLASEAVALGAQDFLAKKNLDGDVLVRALHLARARKQREIAVVAGALRDPLTGLPRPALLQERILRGPARGPLQQGNLALLHLDVDGFGAFADAVGSALAERRLVEIAARLAVELRGTDTLARLDGAAFSVVVDKMTHWNDAALVARRLLAVMCQPFADQLSPERNLGGPTTLSAHRPLQLSIGIAHWHEADEGDGDAVFAALLRRAEMAMYRARAQGGNCYATIANPEPTIEQLGASGIRNGLAG